MNKKRLIWQLPFLILLIVGTILIIRNQNITPYHNDKGMVFGTTYSITYQADSSLHTSIKKELQKVDEALSPFNKQSVITAVNENRNMTVNKMFADVFLMAEKISEDTDGAFDITVAPLVNAWGFGFKSGKHPSRHDIDSLKTIIGYKKVSLNDLRVTKTDPRVMLDCSSIAKGYGSDAVAAMLERHGVKNYMVEIGGEIVTKGISQKRMPWKIGVTKPIDDSLSLSQEIQCIINVTDKAMATSGNYRNFYYHGGKKYAHTIDPKTGYPVQHSILSATVIANNCATADAYATAFMVMGMEKAQKLLERHPELMAYIIFADKDGIIQTWCSPSLKGKITE
ncbi:MAG: FAD:protein FMN transferase [Prevotella sp.]|uniref:FAD:protein FMN transferase n=1 Tax=Prevotella sp. P5-92 TaxID=2024222 RepID=UPI000B970C50|nr:FAD:protein FMN transferase [Prevotella sp. P5-92]MDD6819505.1 FAD:protein FMN transferase [Prevotella sp.]MDY4654378.1 FAD:protein FMN transferase [Prevotella sp.]OYP54452.1 thiamine biosynthesis protein ApbE [Prevotella sp. P5-92]